MSLKVNLRVVAALSLKIDRKIGESSLIVSYFLDRHCHCATIDNTFGMMENYAELFLRTLLVFHPKTSFELAFFAQVFIFGMLA
jgi:hypothetical protein